MDSLIRHQAEIGLSVLVVTAIYLGLVLIPLTARASLRSRVLLGTGVIAKLLAGLLFSIPGMVFNLLVLLLAMGAAAVWLLQPWPRMYDIQPLTVVRQAPEADRLLLYVGGSQDKLLRLLADDPKLQKSDILAVDYAVLMTRREPRLIELAQELYPTVHGAVADPKYKAVVLVGHSVGGLLARWWAAPAEAGKVPAVRALIDLAVPKQGADVGKLAAALGVPAALLAEVGDAAGFPAAAERRWRALEGSAGSAYCIAGDADVAVPRDSALAHCARRDDLAGADHLGIVAPESREALGYRRPAARIVDAIGR